MRPPWLSGASDSESSSEEEVEVTDNQSTDSKLSKSMLDLTLDNNSLRRRILAMQEDEKAMQRLLALSNARGKEQDKFFQRRGDFTEKFFKSELALSEKEKKAQGDAGKIESLSEERKSIFQTFCAEESQLAQDEAGTTLQLLKEVEKLADKISVREDVDQDEVTSLLNWAKVLKQERKDASDNSQKRINEVLAITEAREKALQSNSKEQWASSDDLVKKAKENINNLNKAVQDKTHQINKSSQEKEKKLQDNRVEVLKRLQKEQHRRSKSDK